MWDGGGIHGNNELCIIETTAPAAISAVYYEVESNWDYIRASYPDSNAASGFTPGICPGAPGAPGLNAPPAPVEYYYNGQYALPPCLAAPCYSRCTCGG